MNAALRQTSKALFAALDVAAKPLQGPRILIYHQIGGGSGLEMEVSPRVFEWQLDWILARFPVVDLDTAIDQPHRESVVITFDDGYRSLYELAFPLLVERNVPFALYITTQPVETGVPMREHPGAEPLTWEMIQRMRDSGLLTVGAHTHSHPDLRHIDDKQTHYELITSDNLIASRVGDSPRHFAYPWGYWAEHADGLVRDRYETAALGSRLPRRTSNDRHLVSRVPIQRSDGRLWFKSRIERGLTFEEAVRRRLRAYSGP